QECHRGIYSQMCAPSRPPQAQEPQEPQLDPRLVLSGVAAEVRGEVTFIYPNGQRVQASARTPIVLGAPVIAGPGAPVVFLLLDETSFTVGPNSEITIDRFVYDPMSANVSLRVLCGNFHWVSGRVDRSQIRAINISTPLMVLGIRGTDLEVTVDPGGSG